MLVDWIKWNNSECTFGIICSFNSISFVLYKVWNLVWTNTIKIWKFQYLGVHLGIWWHLYLYHQDLMDICFFYYLQINICKLFENIWIWYFPLKKIQIKFACSLLWSEKKITESDQLEELQYIFNCADIHWMASNAF